MIKGVYLLAAETVRTVAAWAQSLEHPTMLWNEELDVATLMGRTLLLADHILYPDVVFDTLLHNGTTRDLRRAAKRQLSHAKLIAAGIAVPVAQGVAAATRGPAVIEQTSNDLRKPALVSWVRDQLIFEGPTARDAMFVRAIDDYSKQFAHFWLHSRIDHDSLDSETGTFRTALLRPYDPEFDYAPWRKQVTNEAISYFVQRTAERVVTADVFGAEYVSPSVFEARMLRQRSAAHGMRPLQAAIWADIPLLADLSSPDIAKLIQNEGAIDDLRRQVRAALATARSDSENVDAITSLAHNLEAAGHKLNKTARSDLAWQGVIPAGLGAASLAIGALTGGIAAIAAGSLGVLAGVAPFLGTRLESRRDAAYLFVAAQRARS